MVFEAPAEVPVPDAAPVPTAFLVVLEVWVVPLVVLVAAPFLVLLGVELFDPPVLVPAFFALEVPWVFFLCVEPVLPELWELLGAGAGVPQDASAAVSDKRANAVVADCFTINEDSLP